MLMIVVTYFMLYCVLLT